MNVSKLIERVSRGASPRLLLQQQLSEATWPKANKTLHPLDSEKPDGKWVFNTTKRNYLKFANLIVAAAKRMRGKPVVFQGRGSPKARKFAFKGGTTFVVDGKSIEFEDLMEVFKSYTFSAVEIDGLKPEDIGASKKILELPTKVKFSVSGINVEKDAKGFYTLEGGITLHAKDLRAMLKY